MPTRILLAITCLGVISRSTGIDMPKGTSKGYTSARLVPRIAYRSSNQPNSHTVFSLNHQTLVGS